MQINPLVAELSVGAGGAWRGRGLWTRFGDWQGWLEWKDGGVGE